jgi:hypothetical protein
MYLILFIFGVIGLTHILVDSEIMGPIHEWTEARNEWLGKMMDCQQCMGFWCGIVLGLMLLSFNPLIVFAAGCAGSFLAQLGYWTLDALERYTKS